MLAAKIVLLYTTVASKVFRERIMPVIAPELQIEVVRQHRVAKVSSKEVINLHRAHLLVARWLKESTRLPLRVRRIEEGHHQEKETDHFAELGLRDLVKKPKIANIVILECADIGLKEIVKLGGIACFCTGIRDKHWPLLPVKAPEHHGILLQTQR